MKVLLTNPPWHNKEKGRYGVRAGSRWPFTLTSAGGYKPFPFLLAYATSYLNENGIDAQLLDSIVLQQSYEDFFRAVGLFSPDFVVIETSTPSINNDLNIAKKLHEQEYKIILTGSHATIYAQDLIKLDYIDSIVKGEYEKGVLERVIGKGNGIYDYNLFEGLDEIPFPYRDPATLFFYNDNPVGDTGKQIQMWSSRGCPFKCIFCMWPPVMYQNKFRQRSVANVLSEIEECTGRFGDGINIYFDDDTFNINDTRTQELAEE